MSPFPLWTIMRSSTNDSKLLLILHTNVIQKMSELVEKRFL